MIAKRARFPARFPCENETLMSLDCEAENGVFDGGSYRRWFSTPCVQCSTNTPPSGEAPGGPALDCPPGGHGCLSQECAQVTCCYARAVLRELSMNESLAR